MLFAPLLILLVMPVLIDKFSSRKTILTDDSRGPAEERV
jgi:hypothetical protein